MTSVARLSVLGKPLSPSQDFEYQHFGNSSVSFPILDLEHSNRILTIEEDDYYSSLPVKDDETFPSSFPFPAIQMGLTGADPLDRERWEIIKLKVPAWMHAIEPGWVGALYFNSKSVDFVRQQLGRTQALFGLEIIHSNVIHLVAFFRWSRRITMDLERQEKEQKNL